MSLLENAGLALAGIPGGPEYGMYRQFKEGNGYTPTYSSRAPITAKDVRLIDPLKKTVGGYAQAGQSSLADALGKINNQITASQIASGRQPGQYTGQALTRADILASRGINDTAAGVLGQTSLKDTQNEQAFQDNMALAREIGALNSPSLIQEILGAVNGTADAAGKAKALYDAIGSRNQNYSGSTTYGVSANPFVRYDTSRLRGYTLQPNELNNYGQGWG